MTQAPACAADFFTVEGIKVDVTAENAMAARDQAFEKAQQAAFAALFSRMAKSPGAQSAAIPASNISSMIQDYEITEEKLSSVRYIGTYTFRFRPAAVRRYLAGAGIAYVENPEEQVPENISPTETPPEKVSQASATSSAPGALLVLPFLEEGGRTVLWLPSNEWMQAWSRSQNEGSGVLITPLGDLDDVRNIGDAQALTYDPEALSEMIARYGAREAVVAVAAEAPEGVRVRLYRTDGSRPEEVQQINVMAQPGQTRAAIFEAAVRKVRSELQKDWKQPASPMQAFAESKSIRVLMHPASLQEWAQTQKALTRVKGVRETILRSLSPRQAYVDIVFQGTPDDLKKALAQNDMTLESPDREGYWKGDSLVYELRFNRDRESGYSNRF